MVNDNDYTVGSLWHMLLDGGSHNGSFSTIQSPLITIITPWVLIYCRELAPNLFSALFFCLFLQVFNTIPIPMPLPSMTCVCSSGWEAV